MSASVEDLFRHMQLEIKTGKEWNDEMWQGFATLTGKKISVFIRNPGDNFDFGYSNAPISIVWKVFEPQQKSGEDDPTEVTH